METLKMFGFGSIERSPKDFTKPDLVLQLGVESLRIELLTFIDGIEDFRKAFKNCDVAVYEELKINFIGYQDLITNKASSDRLQDRRDIVELKKVNE